MNLLRETARLVWEACWYGAASRRLLLPTVLVAAIVTTLVVITVQVVTPLVLYPML